MPLEGGYEPSPQDWVREQVKRYEESCGREANTFRDTGFPVVIFSTRGAKSGRIRKQPLMRIEWEGAYAMVASLGGAAADPAWVHNLRIHPDEVAVQDGPVPWDGVARELHGEQRAVWWRRAIDIYPRYAELQRNTDRLFPIFVVERRGD